MSATRPRGVIAAIATPVTGEGAPDAGRLRDLAVHLLANGCDGLNVLGTTGEATSFSLEQRTGLMRAAAAAPPPLHNSSSSPATGETVSA